MFCLNFVRAGSQGAGYLLQAWTIQLQEEEITADINREIWKHSYNTKSAFVWISWNFYWSNSPPDVCILTIILFQLRTLMYSVPRLLSRNFTCKYNSVACKTNRNTYTTQHRAINYFPFYFIKRFPMYKFHIGVIYHNQIRVLYVISLSVFCRMIWFWVYRYIITWAAFKI